MNRFTFRPLGRGLRTFAIYTGGASAVGASSFYLWTRQCYFESIGPENDSLFSHIFLRKLNPRNNPTSHDCCTRDVPFSKIKPELIEDARQGGNKLMEAYAAGMWGGYGYAIQRRVMELLPKDEASKDDVWTTADLKRSTYEPGTVLTNHFLVIDKSPKTLTLRACMAPRQDPSEPQEFDCMAQLGAEVDEAREVVVLRLKCITFDATEKALQVQDPFGGVGGWLHRRYSTLLVESGAGNCVR